MDVKWILVNRNHGGFYRVAYDDKNWKALADQLLKDHMVNNLYLFIV